MSDSSRTVIDFSVYAITKDASVVSDKDLKPMAERLVSSLQKDGFLYLTNHGVKDELINNTYSHGKSFFALPPEIKSKYHMDMVAWHGYAPMKSDRKSPEDAPDLHESLNFTVYDHEKTPTEVPNLKEYAWNLMAETNVLAERVLHTMAIGLKMPGRNFFSKLHPRKEEGALRLNHFPPLDQQEDGDCPDGEQLRFFEHTDVSSITLLIFDEEGLEVKSASGCYVSAPPIPGAVLVIIGDVMQHWTNGRLLATSHRVVLPDDADSRRRSRFSIVNFQMPRFDAVITPVGDKKEYQPFTVMDLIKAHKATYVLAQSNVVPIQSLQ